MAKKKKKKPARPRTRRRALARQTKKLIADREKLAALEVGGSPERPLDAPSASVVEAKALELGCLHCPGPARVESQDALRVDERVLRRVRLTCPRCGAARAVWVRIVGHGPN